MSTLMSLSRTMLRFLHLRKGALALCFSLILMGVTVPTAFASTHAQSTTTATTATSQEKLRNIIQLGLDYPGGVVMVDTKVGWTQTNTLRRTSDGGKTWKTVAQPTSQEGIGWTWVLSAKVAWYLTFDKETYATTALYRTNDGGQTWTRFAWIDSNQNLQRISIPDNQSAWVSTSDSNGGSHIFLVGGASQNWQEATVPAQGNAGLYFISQEAGLATVFNSNPDPNGSSTSALYRTSNGGQTWTQMNLPAPADVPTTATTTNIRFLGFGNQQEGYLQATFGDTNSYITYHSYIYRTLDGGQTWQAYGTAVPENINRVTQIENWHVTFAGTVNFTINGQVGLASLQAGRWNVQNVTLPASNSGEFLGVLSSNTLFVSTGNSDNTAQILYKSQNGGNTWQEVVTLPN